MITQEDLKEIRKLLEEEFERGFNRLEKEIEKMKAWTPPVLGRTYTRDGNHVLVGERRPLAKDADLRPDSLFKRKSE